MHVHTRIYTHSEKNRSHGDKTFEAYSNKNDLFCIILVKMAASKNPSPPPHIPSQFCVENEVSHSYKVQ